MKKIITLIMLCSFYSIHTSQTPDPKSVQPKQQPDYQLRLPHQGQPSPNQSRSNNPPSPDRTWMKYSGQYGTN